MLHAVGLALLLAETAIDGPVTFTFSSFANWPRYGLAAKFESPLGSGRFKQVWALSWHDHIYIVSSLDHKSAPGRMTLVMLDGAPPEYVVLMAYEGWIRELLPMRVSGKVQMSVVEGLPTVTVEEVMEPFTSGETKPYEPGKEDLIKKVFRYDPAAMRFSLHTQEYLWYDPSSNTGYVTSGPY